MPDRTQYLLLLLALACAFFVSAMAAANADASYTSNVSVVTHELHAGECLDPVFLGCERPELRVDAVLDTNDGRQLVGCQGPTNGSFFNIVEDQTVCSPTAMTGDYTVRLTLLDVDACPAGSTNCSEQTQAANLTAGPGEAWQVGPFPAGMPVNTTVTTSGGSSTMRFTITAAPVATAISIFAPAGTEGGTPVVRFDPTLGQRVPFKATLSQPTRVEYSVHRRGGGGDWSLHVGPYWGTSVNLDWDGTAPGSATPLPDGVYDLRLRDLAHRGPGPAAVASRPVEIRRTPPAVVDVRLDDLAPTSRWDFRNGPITARGTTTADGTVRLEVAPLAGSVCGSDPPIRQGSPVQRPRGGFELEWDGLDDLNQPVAPGIYCLRARLVSTGGVTRISDARQITVLPASSGLEAWAFPDPMVPIAAAQASRSASIRAMVVDGAHATRHAYRVSIEVSPAGAPGQPVRLAARTVATCERAETCSVPLPPDLARATAIAYRAVATEAPGAPGGPATWTGPWRITDLNPLPLRNWRASVPATVDATGMLTTPPVSSTLDVAYYAGTGNDLADPVQASAFASQVAGNVAHVLGLGSDRGRSSLATSSTAVSFVVSPQDTVLVRGAGQDICSWSGFAPVSYANAHGVVHRVGCRDAAYSHSRQFSSDNPQTDWHELHHALYGLGDEYCCDSNYGLGAGVNIYSSEAACMRDSSPGAVCTRLIDRLTGSPATPAQINIWRGDPLPDVMVRNEVAENADDLRQAAATFSLCGSGRC